MHGQNFMGSLSGAIGKLRGLTILDLSYNLIGGRGFSLFDGLADDLYKYMYI